jgi:hypothetical protein
LHCPETPAHPQHHFSSSWGSSTSTMSFWIFLRHQYVQRISLHCWGSGVSTTLFYIILRLQYTQSVVLYCLGAAGHPHVPVLKE